MWRLVQRPRSTPLVHCELLGESARSPAGTKVGFFEVLGRSYADTVGRCGEVSLGLSASVSRLREQVPLLCGRHGRPQGELQILGRGPPGSPRLWDFFRGSEGSLPGEPAETDGRETTRPLGGYEALVDALRSTEYALEILYNLQDPQITNSKGPLACRAGSDFQTS